MFFANQARFITPKFLMLCLFLSACNEDLIPSSSDERTGIREEGIGSQVGQIAAEFTVIDSNGETITLSDELTFNPYVVLYFTMWCSLCDTHMASLQKSIRPKYPNLRFLMIDYVTNSVRLSRSAQLLNGYEAETVLVDTGRELADQFRGDMGSTVVIDSEGVIRMNEEYKPSRLSAVLESM
jgi:peroxiredoxin